VPYGITQCYLQPDRGGVPVLTPAKAGTRFSNHGGMQGSVDLVGLVHVTNAANQYATLPTGWEVSTSQSALKLYS